MPQLDDVHDCMGVKMTATAVTAIGVLISALKVLLLGAVWSKSLVFYFIWRSVYLPLLANYLIIWLPFFKSSRCLLSSWVVRRYFHSFITRIGRTSVFVSIQWLRSKLTTVKKKLSYPLLGKARCRLSRDHNFAHVLMEVMRWVKKSVVMGVVPFSSTLCWTM